MKRIPYCRQSIDSGDIRKVVEVLKSDWITQGPKIKEFEDALCSYAGAKYAIVVSSGTAALHLACLAAGIKKGDDVITSPITFVASANCILYCAGRPVFADIQPDTVNIDPEEIKRKINKKTKAIIPVHFAGHPCDMEELNRIAKKSNLTVIEDAAHALGATYKGSRIGSCKYSDMTAFSFHPLKHITTGEGGAVLTNRKDLYDKLLLLRNNGVTKESRQFSANGARNYGTWYYEMLYLGFNYRLTDFQCALGLNQLKKLDNFLKRRTEIVDIYNRNLSKINDIVLPMEKPYVKSSWHLYYIRVKDHRKRKHIFDNLTGSGIGVQVHYIPLYLHPYYRNNFGYCNGLCPLAEEYYRKTLTLPIYPAMSNKQIDKVLWGINNFYNKK